MEGSANTPQMIATRAEILRHAERLFGHYGFWKTNIGDIARCCDMSPGNLYRYFRNKQAIGLAVVASYFELVEAAMEAPLSNPDGTPEARIRAMIETGIEHLLQELTRNPKIVELAEFLCEDEEGLALLNAHVAWKQARIIREIERGIANGTLASDDPEGDAVALSNALKAFWMPMTLAQWRDRETILPELRAILDLAFRGLRAR